MMTKIKEFLSGLLLFILLFSPIWIVMAAIVILHNHQLDFMKSVLEDQRKTYKSLSKLNDQLKDFSKHQDEMIDQELKRLQRSLKND